MNAAEKILEMWDKDSEIDRTEPGRELTNVPKLHSKYLAILSKHRLLAKSADIKYVKMRRLKWEYYTGKLDEEELKERGWEPFPYVLKSELNTYLESDEDLNKLVISRAMHQEIVELCTGILKELNSRTYQLRSLIDWEKFIQGV